MLEDLVITLFLSNPDKEKEEQQTGEEDKLENFVSRTHIVNLPGE